MTHGNGKICYNWVSASFGMADDVSLVINAEVLDSWPYNNEGHIQLDSQSEHFKRIILNYLKGLEKSGSKTITLDQIAQELSLSVEIVEKVCREQDLEILESDEE